ncbi:MAG: filamentous hemagglutinin N-terminal domain-containing protein [Symploca sp. SIO2G7]|nr:filamentous hemagglutinin N-terminal domain-containing protein [Symploca sp. SIO2G7]
MLKFPRLLSILTIVFSLLPVSEALAQVSPDHTLGTENSVIVPLDQFNDQIDGGATRGANLFHSFLEFNVGEDRGVYFANPTGIENILSRITGNKPSNIFGRLGVLGDANLFLLNPNGIFWGENASLDINGSFLATTADGINLGNQGYFSASEPQTSSLLAVEPGALFFNQVANQPGVITNRGNLAIGGNFILSADNLDLQGQLQAGGDLKLHAQDTIKVRDSVANPFIAQAGNELLVQGNQGVDIFALNHPNSGFFSGRDMIFRSANTIGGDAHYTSGGNFRIEQLDGSLGNLFSPYDPIIRASGDVSFDSYTGASLHILAGGSVTIPGNIRITGTDTVANSIQENVTLSNGTIVAIDGSTEPTVDIRAGTTAFGTAGITGNTGGFSTIPGTGGTGTSANITIGSITNEGGLVLLTNQYVPDTILTTGTIQVGEIDTSDRTEAGGNIYIDSRGNFQLTGSLNSSARQDGNAGNIVLLADEQIAIANSEIRSNAEDGFAGFIQLQANNDINVTNSEIKAESRDGNNLGVGGSINITAKTGSIALNEESQLNTSAQGDGFAGSITLNAGNEITLASNSDIRSNADDGEAGFIQLQANNDISVSNSEVQAESKGSNAAGSGFGFIEITTKTGSISLNEGARLNTSATGDGFAGGITLNAGNEIAIASNSEIRSNAEDGFAGFIQLQANNNINVTNSEIRSNADNGIAGFIQLQANNDINVTNGDIKAESRGIDNSGVGGSINITAQTGSIAINEESQLNTSAQGDGFAGNIDLNAGDQITLAGNSEIRSNADDGFAGRINLQANNSVNITNGEVQAQSEGSNNAGGGFGSINITAENGSIALNDGARLNTSATGDGFAGDINLNAGNQITLASDSEIKSNAEEGFAGFIQLRANNDINVTNGEVQAQSKGSNTDGGGFGFIEITAENGSIALNDGARLNTSATGNGLAGYITLEAGNQIIANNSNIQSDAANGLAGAINLQANSSIFLTNTQITADSVPVSGGILIDGEQADGGDIGISSWSLVMTDSTISSNSRGDGDAGNINLDIKDNLLLDNSQVTADSTQAGGGDVNITALDSRLRNGSLISSSVANGDGGGGNINITSPLFLALEDSDILANANQGAGGNININSEAFLADLFASGNAVAVGSNPGDFSQFRGNDRVDISASSQVAGLSGEVNFPDFSFLQNSLSQLSANFVNPEQAIADSCLARRNTQQGSFTVTGTGGLPPAPSNSFSSQYRLRGVQTVGEGTVSHTQVQPTAAIANWELGDPVIEAQGMIATADGRIVLGNEPQLAAMVSVEDVVCEQP